ncbi:MAG TPA: GTPase HflX [Bacteroidales bacterium]|jgi:GTP-binding protein HflX|nr:GTPase HflX [Bacteroidales bacterium]HOF45422.1 GTPase HflX [Bacteroidales bacterium]HOS57798.1 GTPase HflX [Bacteroidales bacterium]HRR04110.1 GTPase HflX [Bacteroidales bacterium]HRT13887.1 GTPase HflX [Bacteroidales bacterium]
MNNSFSHRQTPIEKAILIGVSTPDTPYEKMEEYLEELAFLVETAGGLPIKKVIQNLQFPDPKTYLGSGKLNDVKEYIEENKIDIAVFDDELSPSQIRNIEAVLKCKILDRTNLILDIFSKRAKTAHAKTQVELAQYNYLLPRLTRMWTHLEKQRGGIGMRGPGEKEIETDRRIIRDRIALLKKKLKDIDRQKLTQRSNREQFIRVALVGYTNVGKSTIMNLLSKSDVFAENKLFATLDTTVRKVVFKNLPFLLSDTVGFIRKLPHDLVESFKSTLDELRESDLLLHVVDISHPDFEEQIAIVNQTLEDIKVHDKPIILIFNKIDNYQWIEKEADDLTPKEKCNITLDELKQTWMAKSAYKTLFISAKTKENIEELKETLYEDIKELHVKIYPYNNFLY